MDCAARGFPSRASLGFPEATRAGWLFLPNAIPLYLLFEHDLRSNASRLSRGPLFRIMHYQAQMLMV
jgi:hypothetical protein